MKTLIVIAIVLFSNKIFAEDIQLIIGSNHIRWDHPQEPVENNPGFIYTADNRFLFGIVKNSFDEISYIAGIAYKFEKDFDDKASWRVNFGIASGYEGNRPVPMVVPSVTYYGLTIGFIPTGIFTFGYTVNFH